MRNKKFTILFLAVIMLLSLLSACSKNNNNTPSANTDKKETSQPAATASTEESGYKDYSNGFPEKVTIEIPVYERAFEGWNVADNYYTRWIQKEFGDKYNVTVKYIPIARGNEVQDFQQLLAARKAPDIIFHYDMPQQIAYYSEDVLQPIEWEEVAKYAPTYWTNMSSTIEQYGTINNEKIFFFASRPDADNFLTLIRKDWVEQVGMKVDDLTSLEKFNEMLVKWKDAGLGVAGGNLVRNNFTYNYGFRDWPIDKEYRALNSDLSIADFTTVATERYLRNLNYQFNAGIIDKEFYLRDDDNKVKSEFVAGRTGTYGTYLTSNSDVIAATLANNPTAEFALLPYEVGAPEGLVPQQRAYWPFGFIMGINYQTPEIERIAVWMFLEWMSQPDHLFFLQNGVEGENYTLDAEGIAVKNADFAGESVLAMNNNKDYWALVTEGALYPDPAVNTKAKIRNWSPEGYEGLIEEHLKNYDAAAQYRTPDALFTEVVTTVSEYKADLNELFQELYIKIVTSPEAQFDSLYEAAKKTYLDAGFQKILDEKKAIIEKGSFK
ncbi:ABC transporter substrate-binding protein [Paenibacillus sp. FSL H8-0548]|uniref:extracellular solute-binding protein n=1 Tax=Paenibacillus sp. FSL H8-0548 TaxID=1920422 RepID=UPI00096FCB4E|nr:extracellular solute-binding protein [Paenibacillus sp. FSL H8-0548]OMF38662.1 ABC transporter substrate-binding protein [Paenibacillus sp. FSL H8-0548]